MSKRTTNISDVKVFDNEGKPIGKVTEWQFVIQENEHGACKWLVTVKQ